MSFVDNPNKKQKHPHYEHRTCKLDTKNNEFSSKKFHKVRKVSNHKILIKSFGSIGMCLNEKSTSSISVNELNKVCFILVNDYEGQKDHDLGVGPLNDGYLIGLKHHRLGFKVFYLYNPRSDIFTSFLCFFIKNTYEALTVFYTGRVTNSNGVNEIDFGNGSLSTGVVGDIIAQNCNGKAHVVFMTDSCSGGSVFDIHTINPETNLAPTNMISFAVQKSCTPGSKESMLSHGIFTYYFCKVTSDTPNIIPNRLVERINSSIKRFNEKMICDVSDKEVSDEPIFSNK